MRTESRYSELDVPRGGTSRKVVVSARPSPSMSAREVTRLPRGTGFGSPDPVTSPETEPETAEAEADDPVTAPVVEPVGGAA